MNASPPKKSTPLTIGRLANAAGVGLGTIRFYQKRGLLAEPKRPSYGGFRVYGDADLERLLQIKGAQELGFSLAEIGEIFRSIEQRDCRAMQALVDAKVVAVRSQICQLEKARQNLDGLKALCRDDCTAHECPMVRAICEGARR